ncbi:MAG: CoA synthetase [Betaproteobacteria bacterium]|nr:CoA synthetase [Betaproteobacteria bacterium]
MPSLMRTVEALAAAIPDGAKLAVPRDTCGIAMAVTRELVRRKVRGLHLVCVPTSGLQADILIGAGCVETIETSAVTLGEYGPAHAFIAALRERRIRILDATCPAIHAGLQAAQKGLPFMPLRGLIGSDLVAHRSDWKVIDNPFQPGDPIVALPAIRPDIALFHAPLADRRGNVFIGRERELLTMAHASAQTLVSVEAITDTDLFDDAERSAGVLPAIYVSGVALARRGAWPLAFREAYGDDEAAIARYVRLAKTAEGFGRYVDAWLAGDERCAEQAA